MNNNRPFDESNGVTNKETDSLNFLVERGPIQRLLLQEYVDKVLAAMIHCSQSMDFVWQFILYEISSLDDQH